MTSSTKTHMPVISRFAPSPTGRLHLGHAYSAILAHDLTRRHGGQFLLRIEDIDTTRCREHFIKGIMDDLSWLGLSWDGAVRRQSEHFPDYKAAIKRLQDMGLLYPCICTRKDIASEIAQAASAPHGPFGALYPGTCKRRSHKAVTAAIAQHRPHALRLDVTKAMDMVSGQPLLFYDTKGKAHQARPQELGDVVLARKDSPTSYHLSVTLDDALQGVTHIVRGDDLYHATHIHRLLQALLGLPTPVYQHHPLLTDEKGRRLAKRDGAPDLKSLRENGASPDDIRAEIARLTDCTNKAKP